MIKFNKPANLNGTELLAELNAAGIVITEPPFIDGNGEFWLDIADKDKSAATTIVANHNGTIAAPESIVAAGLSIEELKAALGL